MTRLTKEVLERLEKIHIPPEDSWLRLYEEIRLTIMRDTALAMWVSKPPHKIGSD